MNRDEIMNMQPGRELDSLISEKLMGYVTHGHFREKNGVRILVQPYSTDISAAWEVVEKIQEKKLVRLHVNEGDYICKIGGDLMCYKCNSNSMPEAICKAALCFVQEDTP